ncbi:hypothetical protein [Persephonella sp. KM09-Lau-8]|uniref:hypothetical protein n=1 Tax=Persephonella sp. KM09-Lau-8 TaxID=1158345 RepID=UPI00049657E4|nr:hypothetical protein [Persephonella sp. KM09-Lau-8]
MGKIIKFNKPQEDENNQQKSEIESHSNVKNIFSVEALADKVRKGVEEYILYNFAVKEILGMDIVFKENDKKEIGVLGAIAYEHKRKPGTFIADFIGKGHIDNKDNVVIDELAFRAGEPEYYNTISKILKAKKLLPEIKEKE